MRAEGIALVTGARRSILRAVAFELAGRAFGSDAIALLARHGDMRSTHEMKAHFGLLFAALLLFASCGDSGSDVCDNACSADQLAASLSSDHTPANGVLLESLIGNELGSEPFYLVEYWRLDPDNPEAEALLARYDEVLAPQLELVGARIALDNVVFNQPTMFEGREWSRVRILSWPSPQAFLEVIQTEAYQQAIQWKHQATLALQSLWVETVFAARIVDPFPDKAEFYNSNLLTTRDVALYPDGTSGGLTGAEASKLYTDVVREIFAEIGAYLAFQGSVKHLVLGTDDQWEIYNLVYYPSIPDMLAMTTDPRFLAVRPNKGAGLSRNSVMMTRPLIDPEL